MKSSYENHLRIKKERCDALRSTLERMYPEPVELHLEIGCGHGHYLTAFAENHREEVCLGVDLVTKRIEKATAKRDKRSLTNLNFIKADIKELMECLPESIRIKRIFILFPDPWPKNRHAKHRIIQTKLLDLLGERVEKGTQLCFRTDHEGQFAWGLEIIGSHPGWLINDCLEWPFENSSFFQDMMDDYYSLIAEWSPDWESEEKEEADDAKLEHEEKGQNAPTDQS